MPTTKELEEKLSELYYNPRTGFQTKRKLYQTARANGIQVSEGDVQRFLEKQEVHQITKQVQKPKEFSTIYAPEPMSSVQTDVCIYDRYQIDGYKYILGVIDVYSRYAICRPLTNLRVDTLLTEMKSIFDEFENLTGERPKNINADNEFNNTKFNEYFSEQNIHNVVFSQPEQLHKNAIIERFWRTLSLLLQRWRIGSGDKRWYKVLPDIVENYNNTENRTLKASPIDVISGKKDNPVERNQIPTNLSVGDRVSIKIHKERLGKGDVETFSREIYVITEKSGQKNRIKNLQNEC